jgi:hypothetical protein
MDAGAVPAQRPTFTVVSTNGIRYDANNLVYARDWAERAWVVHFVCSGIATKLRADQIRAIEYLPAGASYCGFCDGPLNSLG